MGIWDSVRSRLGRGARQTDDYQEYDDYDYEDTREDYDADDEYGEEDRYAGYGDRPAAMRSYGVDRADYYNDNHAPLVTQADVRSQPIPLVAGQAQDRIPVPRAYPRGTKVAARPERPEDVYAFKNGLARTPGSLAQLQSERLRMEDTGRLTAVSSAGGAVGVAGGAGGAGVGVASAGVVGVAGTGAAVVDATSRFEQRGQAAGVAQARGLEQQALAQGQVRQRVHRRIEHIRPMTYGDAEQVAQELKKGVLVVLDLRTTRPELAKRILDFSFGVASALEGQVDRHVDRVYIFTRNGPLTDGERAAIRI
jgi:cell division inhibitor SepF